MTTDALPLPEYPIFSLRELILQGNLLLASSGKEFTKPTGILSSAAEVKKARKEAMGRLGLDFLETVADDIGLDKEFAADMEVDIDENSIPPPPPPDSADGIQLAAMDLSTSENQDPSPQTRSVTPTVPSPTDSHEHVAQEADVGALSARERNRLKRKRKPGNSAFVVAPPPQSTGAKYSAAPTGSSHK